MCVCVYVHILRALGIVFVSVCRFPEGVNAASLAPTTPPPPFPGLPQTPDLSSGFGPCSARHRTLFVWPGLSPLDASPQVHPAVRRWTWVAQGARVWASVGRPCVRPEARDGVRVAVKRVQPTECVSKCEGPCVRPPLACGEGRCLSPGRPSTSAV